MSSLECAGLILATLPLLISALEDYHDSIDPAKSFWTSGRELPQFIRKLQIQKLIFEQSLLSLLSSVGGDEDVTTLSTFGKQGVTSERWDDLMILQHRVHERLGGSSGAFGEIIGAVLSVVQSIAKDLKLNDLARVCGTLS
jgi:hypothetical protein